MIGLQEAAFRAGSLRVSLSDLVRSALRRRGLELRRVEMPPTLPGRPLPSAGLVVELVGPSGVGKTETLSRATAAIRDRWYLQEDVKHHLENALKLPSDLQALYEELAQQQVRECYAQERPLAERTARAAYCLSVLRADMALAAKEYSKGFFLHDGLTHNFSVPLLKMLRQRHPGAEAFVRSRNYVFVLADRTETVVRNILKRRKQTPAFFANNLPGLSAPEIESISHRRNRTARELADRVQQYADSVLIIRAEDDIEANRDRILQFEKELLARAADPARKPSRGRKVVGGATFRPACDGVAIRGLPDQSAS